MKKSILFFYVLSIIFITYSAFCNPTRIEPVIVNDPIVKKYYPFSIVSNDSRVEVILNDSKNRTGLSSNKSFGYIDTNDYLYDFTEVTSNAGGVTDAWGSRSSLYKFKNMQEDKHGNIIAGHNFGIGRFDGKNGQCMLGDQYEYLHSITSNNFYVTGDTLCYARYESEIYRFPYDITTNTYIPITETDYPECLENPNTTVFPYYKEPYEDGNYYKLGKNFIAYEHNSNASYHVVHNKDNGQAVGFTSYGTIANDWNALIDFHPAIAELSSIHSVCPGGQGYYVYGSIIQTNPTTGKTQYQPTIATFPPGYTGDYSETINTYPALFDKSECSTVPVSLMLYYQYFKDGHSLYYICDALLYYNGTTNEGKRIPIPQTMLDYCGNCDNRIFAMIQPSEDEIGISGYNGIFVCNLDALINSANPIPIEEIDGVLPKLGFSNVYPNPSTNRTVTAEIICYDKNLSTIEIGLYNQIGQKLLDLSKNYSHNSTEHSINLTFTVPENIPSGMYYLTVHNGDEHKAQPIVITDY